MFIEFFIHKARHHITLSLLHHWLSFSSVNFSSPLPIEKSTLDESEYSFKLIRGSIILLWDINICMYKYLCMNNFELTYCKSHINFKIGIILDHLQCNYRSIIVQLVLFDEKENNFPLRSLNIITNDRLPSIG